MSKEMGFLNTSFLYKQQLAKQPLVKKTTKSNVSTQLAGLVLVAAGLTLSSSIFAKESAQLNLRDVSIPTLIETISRITGKSFVVDPRVKGKVTVITNSDMDADELYDTFLSILQVHGFSAVPSGSGSKLIKIVPSNQAKQQPVPVIGEEEERRYKAAQKKRKQASRRTKSASKKPTREQLKALQNLPKKRNADELITRVIRVEHVPAAMLVPILRPLVPSTGQLQAYGPSNTILISDRAANIERLVKVIKRMDRVDDEVLEVVPLKFASAKELARTIQILQRSSIKGARSKNRISADVRTNSLLLSGDKSSRQQVRKIIRQLDTYQRAEEKTRVVYLKYAKAVDLAKVLAGFSKTQKTTRGTKKGGAGTQAAAIDIQADEATNSLIITAEPEIQRNLTKVIARLDVRRAQVLVEAIIAEVSEGLSKTLGSSLGFSMSKGLLGGSGTVAGVGALLNVFAGGANSAAGVVPPSGGGRLGLVDNIGKNKFGLLIDALSGDGATNILSTPTVVALDNQEATLVVGENVPFVTGSYTSTGGNGNTNSTPSNPFQTIERRDIGITLKIKPQINDGSSIRLDIEQEVSSLRASASTAAERITNKSTINTSVMVEDGQVLVLGGLMRDVFRDQITKVPVLGNIPIVGKLFRSSTTEKTKTNLMVFIHPVIMRDVLSGDFYTRQKYNKLLRAQATSKVVKRGILGDKAQKFPANIKQNMVKHLSQAQKKQIILREQRQRVLAHNRKIQQGRLAQQEQNRMAQQRKASTVQSKSRPVVRTYNPSGNQSGNIPARLRNVMPPKRN